MGPARDSSPLANRCPFLPRGSGDRTSASTTLDTAARSRHTHCSNAFGWMEMVQWLGIRYRLPVPLKPWTTPGHPGAPFGLSTLRSTPLHQIGQQICRGWGCRGYAMPPPGLRGPSTSVCGRRTCTPPHQTGQETCLWMPGGGGGGTTRIAIPSASWVCSCSRTLCTDTHLRTRQVRKGVFGCLGWGV